MVVAQTPSQEVLTGEVSLTNASDGGLLDGFKFWLRGGFPAWRQRLRYVMCQHEEVPVEDRKQRITDCALSVMHGWEFVTPLTGFGWAPERHLRAELTGGAQYRKVVIRQSWSIEGYTSECYLYQSVLPGLTIRTPKLFGTFTLDPEGSKWMILEDSGSRQPTMGDVADRKAFLATLGCLHGQGRLLVQDSNFSMTPLPEFPRDTLNRDDLNFGKWRSVLLNALTDHSFGVEELTVNLLDCLWLQLSRQPKTLLHGDTDASNAVWVDGEIALFDWERALIGPACLDLGRLMEYLTSTIDELDTYREMFNKASEESLSVGEMYYIADLGKGYNNLRWVCYYIEQVTGGNPPSWGEETYHGFLNQLRSLCVTSAINRST